MNNFVTVIIPAKIDTAAALAALERAIDSAYRNDCRVVVIDDNSVMSFECDLSIVSNGGPVGPGHTRNRALSLVMTPYVIALDADDELLEGAVDKLLAHAAPETVVYGDCIIGGVRVRQQPTSIGSLLCAMSVPAVTVLYPTQVLADLDGWPEDWPAFEDVALWAKLLDNKVRPIYIPETIFVYNKHDGSLSATMDTGALWQRLRDTYSEQWQRAKMCGCGRKNQKQYEDAVANLSIDNPWSLVYIGKRKSQFGYKGPATGKRYHVDPLRHLTVEKDDRERMIKDGLFIDSPTEIIAHAPRRTQVWESVVNGA